jgi:hypothetical protein
MKEALLRRLHIEDASTPDYDSTESRIRFITGSEIRRAALRHGMSGDEIFLSYLAKKHPSFCGHAVPVIHVHLWAITICMVLWKVNWSFCERE